MIFVKVKEIFIKKSQIFIQPQWIMILRVLPQDFFSSVQNKLHFAIHGNTAAEVLY